MGPVADPSSQMVEQTSSRVVVRMARLTSVDVSLTARANATAPLKPKGRKDIADQITILLLSIKQPLDNQQFEGGSGQLPM